MSITPFLEGAAFNPETIELLASAFDAAWDTVMKSGSPLAGDARAAATRERLAKRIIALAQRGERDHRRLVEDALAHLTEAK